jgi:hypothetical protein
MSGKPIDNAVWNAWRDGVLSRASDEAIRIVETIVPGGLKAESGGKWVGLSPWRKERTPSFYLFKDGGCHDFGTGEHKDAVGALQLAKNLGFREALEECAAILGMPSWEDTKRANKGSVIDEAALDEQHRHEAEERRVQELSTRIVHHLWRTLPDQVRAYIHTRYGLSDETIDCEKIGWIPAGLFGECQKLWPEVSVDDWLATGFFKQYGGAVSVMWNMRILFPYWKGGLVVYTISRLCDAWGPANLPDWEQSKFKKLSVYDKEKYPYISTTISNKWLWNEDVLKSRMATLLITEGIADAMIAKQIGIPVVSPVTIKPREQDFERLIEITRRHVAGRVVVINDNEENESGKKGARATARRLWIAGQRVGVSVVPKADGVPKYDLNDFIRDRLAAGAEEDAVKVEVEALMRGALDYPRFLLEEIPKDTAAVDLAPHLPALAEAMVPMSGLARSDFESAVKKRFHGVKGATLQKELDKALKTALATAKEKGLVIEGMAVKPGEDTVAEGEEPAAPKKPSGPKNHEGLKGAVVVHPDGYYDRIGTAGREQVSTFCLTLTRVVKTPLEPDRLVVRVEGPDEGVFAVDGDKKVLCEEWIVPHKAWGSKRNFIAAFPTPCMQWTGGDDEVQGVLALLTDESVYEAVPTVAATPILGRHAAPDGTLRFVLPNGTIRADGWMPDPDLIYLPSGNVLDRWLPSDQSPIAGDDVKKLAQAAIPLLLEAQPLNVSLTCLAWLFGSPFAPEVRKRVGGYPLLNPWGTQGGGKSTFVLKSAALLYQRAESISVKATPFAVTKTMAYANALPVIFDEYKPSDMGRSAEQFRRRIRTAYSGETELRGHMDQTVSDYPLQAPLVISGETRIEDDPALIERTLYAPFDKAWLNTDPEAKPAMRKLRLLSLWKLGPAIFAWSLGADVDAMLAEAEALWTASSDVLCGSEIPTRMANNLLVSLFGLVVLKRWCADFGVTLPELDAKEHLKRLLSGIFENFDGTTEIRAPLDVCDLFVMRAARLIAAGAASEGIHWQRHNGLIALHISSIESLSRSEAHHQGLTLDTPGESALRRAFREKKAMQTNGHCYVVDFHMQVWLKPKSGTRTQQRCVVIDPAKMPIATGLSNDSFPVEAPEPTNEELLSTWKRSTGGAGARPGMA